PYDYIVEIINYITASYDVSVLFNYAPHQKGEALKIYGMCRNKAMVHHKMHAATIRDFIRLMYRCDMLISNEGGSVHIAKALKKPTFTIYSPFIKKEHWCSFEDGAFHQSIHLKEERPELYKRHTKAEMRKIERSPETLYHKLTPGLIFQKLKPYLEKRIPAAQKQ
ncbi:MAG: glycosyltransferase family 9 protein, partial [Marinirhabdus sp.]